MSLVIRSSRVICKSGTRPRAVHVQGDCIERIAEWGDVPRGAVLVDAGNHVIMPGIVDTHVHVNEPGRGDWEGFASATRAAAAGGVTTVLDMPLNSVPATTTVAALEAKREAALGKTLVNVGYIGGVVPGNAAELEGLRDAGVRAFKCFMSPSGVAEFPSVSEADLREAFPVLARIGLPLMVHAEDPALLLPPGQPSILYDDYLATRPVEAEHAAVELLVRLMSQCSIPIHIVHLSSASTLGIIGDAKARDLPITVETCPHYLSFASDEIPEGATEYKCAPPVRSSAEREALWRALIAGDIDLVASDHSPCPPRMKQTGGDFFGAWGGIASLQISLAAVWTGARARGVPLEQLVTWMSAGPARLAGYSGRKGILEAGADADIVIWDPDTSFVVDGAKLYHRHSVTPYEGRDLFGRVLATYVAGERVFSAESGFH